MPLEAGEILYNARSGRYVYADSKRFVPRAVVLNLVDREQQRTEVRLKGLTRSLSTQKITLADWQQRSAQTLKAAHIRMAALAAGGKDRLTPQHYGAIGAQLRQQYNYLHSFATAIAEGKVTEARAITRSAAYASSIRPTFSRAEQITRTTQGFTQAKRSLDPQSRHCSSCLEYATYGWIAIDQIIPIGAHCQCGQHCHCSIAYR